MTFNIMTFVTFAFVYILVWWIVIFCVLPWGNNLANEKTVGFANSAPANPRIGLKLVVTTIISFIVTGIIYALSYYTGFSVLDVATY